MTQVTTQTMKRKATIGLGNMQASVAFLSIIWMDCWSYDIREMRDKRCSRKYSFWEKCLKKLNCFKK